VILILHIEQLLKLQDILLAQVFGKILDSFALNATSYFSNILLATGEPLTFATKFFSIQDRRALLDIKTGVPILELFYRAVKSKCVAVGLKSLILVAGMGCVIVIHTW